MKELYNVGKTLTLSCDTCYEYTEHFVSEGVYTEEKSGISENYICSQCKTKTIMMYRYVAKPTLGGKEHVRTNGTESL